MASTKGRPSVKPGRRSLARHGHRASHKPRRVDLNALFAGSGQSYIICKHIFIYIYTHTYIHTRIYIYICICIYIYIYVYVYIYIGVIKTCVYIYVYIYMSRINLKGPLFTCVNTCMYIYIFIHIYIIKICVYIYVYTYISRFVYCTHTCVQIYDIFTLSTRHA